MKIFSVALCTMFVFCGLAVSGQERQLPKVIAAPVVEINYTREVYESGETSAEESAALVARVKGYLTKVNFEEGAHVKAGTVLFEIDPKEYEAKVKQAKAELAKAKAQQQHDDTEEQRQRELFEKNAISAKEYAHYQAKKLESDASVLAAEAALDLAELDLKYTKILAPFDGYMGFKKYSVGNLVGAQQNDTLATIEKSGKIKVNFFLADMDAGKLTSYIREKKLSAKDIPVEMFLQDGKKVDLKGNISAWDNKIDPDTGTLRMQAIFNDPNRKMIPGVYVLVKLKIGDPEQLLAVRKSAVSQGVAGYSVMVLKNPADGVAEVEQRYLKPAVSDDQFFYFKEGLKVNELVVVSGIQRVRNGIKCAYTLEGASHAQ